MLQLLILLPLLVNSESVNDPNTKINQGHLKGKWLTTRGGRIVAAFTSIPYAAAPIGPLRFQSPQAAMPWSGVYSATKEVPGCIQSLDLPGVTKIDEDCLFLNVYTPEIRPIERLPVLVFIHGGSFQKGSSNSSIFGPEYLLDEDILLVTINYRLGILGFLSLEDSILPGNLGLKDQLFALKWIKRNICSFGGDPKKITIFGQSSGAASVQLLIQFTKNEGLFRAGICNSGSSLSPFALQWPGAQSLAVDKLAKLTECPRKSLPLLQCLKKLPAVRFETLGQELAKTDLDIKRHVPVFTPVVEPRCAKDALITSDPWSMSLDIPLLQGTNQYDGLIRSIGFELGKTDIKFKELNNNYKTVLPYNLYIDGFTNVPEEVAEMLKSFYLGTGDFDRKHFLDLVLIVTDGMYNYPLVQATKLSKNKLYSYQLNYEGSNTFTRFFNSDRNYGVSHGDDLFYLFPYGGPTELNITEADTIFSKKLVKLWTNFVSYMDPTPSSSINPITTMWTPVKTDSIEFLNITQDGFIMDDGFLQRRMSFWDTVPFRNKPFLGRPQC